MDSQSQTEPQESILGAANVVLQGGAMFWSGGDTDRRVEAKESLRFSCSSGAVDVLPMDTQMAERCSGRRRWPGLWRTRAGSKLIRKPGRRWISRLGIRSTWRKAHCPRWCRRASRFLSGLVEGLCAGTKCRAIPCYFDTPV
jgi:hypothetical protein